MFMEVVVHLLLGFATCEALNDALHGPWVAGDGCCILAKLGSHGLQVPPNKLHLCMCTPQGLPVNIPS